jgi:hypothetical protein
MDNYYSLPNSRDHQTFQQGGFSPLQTVNFAKWHAYKGLKPVAERYWNCGVNRA